MEKFIKNHYRKIIFCSLILLGILSILNAKNDSLIYDEDAHIPAGYSYLTQFDMRLNPEHPPLLKDLAALPLMFLHLNFDVNHQDFWNQNPNDAEWNAGKYFLFNAGNNPDRIIFYSRLPIIFLFLAFSLFVFKWADELAGLHAGLLAFILFAFDPNLLGHNHFVTTDLGIAVFVTLAFYYFIKFLKNPSWINVLTLGFFLTLVQLAKFSSILIFPIFCLSLIIYPLSLTDPKKLKSLAKYWGKFLTAFFISLVLVWIVYYFSTFNMPESKLPEIANYYFNKDNPQTIIVKKILFFLNGSDFFRPMAIYLFGIVRVFQRVAGGNVAYFFGEVSTQGFFSYFPIVFLIKEPIPTLLLIFSALGIGAYWIKSGRFFHHLSLREITAYIRTHITEITLLAFILLYVISSITGRLNIGIRHLFPIFPLIYILTAKAIFEFIKRLKNKRLERLAKVSIITLSGVLILMTVHAYPGYTSYFNELVGGPKNGYRYVTDSNADWGQDLKRLENFLEEHPEIENIHIDYFGLADLQYYIKTPFIPWWKERRPIEPGWYAISALFVQEGIYDSRLSDDQSYRWLKNKTPIYQVGTSILIYKITSPEAALINN